MSCANFQELLAGQGAATATDFTPANIDFPYDSDDDLRLDIYNYQDQVWVNVPLATGATINVGGAGDVFYAWETYLTNGQTGVRTILATAGTTPALPSSATASHPLAPANNVFPVESGSGVNVRLYRQTAINAGELPAYFYPGASIRAQDLNDNFEALRKVVEEGACSTNNVNDAAPQLDQRYWNKITDTNGGDTAISTDNWPDNDTTVATTAAIDNRIDTKITEGTVGVGGKGITISGKKVINDIDTAAGLKYSNNTDSAQIQVNLGTNLTFDAGTGAINAGDTSNWQLNTSDLSPKDPDGSTKNVAIGGTNSNAPIYLGSNGIASILKGAFGSTSAPETTAVAIVSSSDAANLGECTLSLQNTTAGGRALNVYDKDWDFADDPLREPNACIFEDGKANFASNTTVGGTLDVTGAATAAKPADHDSSTQLVTTSWVEMKNLQDVEDAIAPVDGQVLVYNGGDSEWEAGEQVPNALRFKGTCRYYSRPYEGRWDGTNTNWVNDVDHEDIPGSPNGPWVGTEVQVGDFWLCTEPNKEVGATALTNAAQAANIITWDKLTDQQRTDSGLSKEEFDADALVSDDNNRRGWTEIDGTGQGQTPVLSNDTITMEYGDMVVAGRVFLIGGQKYRNYFRIGSVGGDGFAFWRRSQDGSDNIIHPENLQDNVAVGGKSVATANHFLRDDTDALFCLKGGNVGIQKSNPSAPLHVASSDENIIRLQNTTAFNDVAGTDPVSDILYHGQKNGIVGHLARIRVRQDGTWSSVNAHHKPTALEFMTQDSTSTDQSLTPRLTIDTAGNVGINISTPASLLTIKGGSTGRGGVLTNNQIRIQSGTSVAYAGSISFGKKPDTDVYYALAIDALTNNVASDILLAPSGGNVSIGTDDPKAKLDIAQNSGTNPGDPGHLMFSATPSNKAMWQFRSSSSNTHLFLDRTWSDVWATAVAINRSNGNVGIGTDGSAYRLDIESKDSDIIRAAVETDIVSKPANILLQGTNSSGASSNQTILTSYGLGSNTLTAFGINVRNNGDTFGSPNRVATFLGSGNVGIGTDNPQEKLHVTGTVRISTLDGDGIRNVVADEDGTLAVSTTTTVDSVEATIDEGETVQHCADQPDLTLRCTAVGKNSDDVSMTGVLSYQWIETTTGADVPLQILRSEAVSGGNTDTLLIEDFTISPANGSRKFKCTVTFTDPIGGSKTKTTPETTVTLAQAISILTSPVDIDLNNGETGNFTVTIAQANADLPAITPTYVWKINGFPITTTNGPSDNTNVGYEFSNWTTNTLGVKCVSNTATNFAIVCVVDGGTCSPDLASEQAALRGPGGGTTAPPASTDYKGIGSYSLLGPTTQFQLLGWGGNFAPGGTITWNGAYGPAPLPGTWRVMGTVMDRATRYPYNYSAVTYLVLRIK